MKFLYGYGGIHYIDISSIIFKECIKDDGIFVPSGDVNRSKIIGWDPYPNILKHIIVVDHNSEHHIYEATKEIDIKFKSISNQLNNEKNPKIWWNSIGKFIEDPVDRLNKLQKKFNLKYINWGGFEYEYPEQLMCISNIKENDKVLEIGGNIGRTAHIIHTIVNNPKNHIVMECDLEMARQLRHNLDMNTYTDLRIETDALSKTKLYNLNGCPRPIDECKVTSDIKVQPTISYSEICTKYDVDFNVLVADCEGSLYYILLEDPDMLNNMHTVIMENDYTDMNHKIAVDLILRKKGFSLVYQEKGVPDASWSVCYHIFYEVWKK
jgi:FkbM family methyltransferase